MDTSYNISQEVSHKMVVILSLVCNFVRSFDLLKNGTAFAKAGTVLPLE